MINIDSDYIPDMLCLTKCIAHRVVDLIAAEFPSALYRIELPSTTSDLTVGSPLIDAHRGIDAMCSASDFILLLKSVMDCDGDEERRILDAVGYLIGTS